MNIWMLYFETDYEGGSEPELFWVLKPTAQEVMAVVSELKLPKAEKLLVDGYVYLDRTRSITLSKVSVNNNA